jgi:hypothetical protein
MTADDNFNLYEATACIHLKVLGDNLDYADAEAYARLSRLFGEENVEIRSVKLLKKDVDKDES